MKASQKASSPESLPSDVPQQPPKSRNARAQARHRAKRKAYIEQLEETVNRLQGALALTPDQLAALPSAQTRIQELEQENLRLRGELEIMKAQMTIMPPEHLRRQPAPFSMQEAADCARHLDPRDVKRRKMSPELDQLFLQGSLHSAHQMGGPPGRTHSMVSLPPLPSSIPPGCGPLSPTLSSASPVYPMSSFLPYTSNLTVQASSASSASSSPYSASTISSLPETVSSAKQTGESFRDPSDVPCLPQTSTSSVPPAFANVNSYPHGSSAVKRESNGMYMSSLPTPSYLQPQNSAPFDVDFSTPWRGFPPSRPP